MSERAVRADFAALGTGDKSFRDGSPLALALEETRKAIDDAFAGQDRITVTVKHKSNKPSVKKRREKKAAA